MAQPPNETQETRRRRRPARKLDVDTYREVLKKKSVGNELNVSLEPSKDEFLSPNEPELWTWNPGLTQGHHEDTYKSSPNCPSPLNENNSTNWFGEYEYPQPGDEVTNNPDWLPYGEHEQENGYHRWHSLSHDHKPNSHGAPSKGSSRGQDLQKNSSLKNSVESECRYLNTDESSLDQQETFSSTSQALFHRVGQSPIPVDQTTSLGSFSHSDYDEYSTNSHDMLITNQKAPSFHHGSSNNNNVLGYGSFSSEQCDRMNKKDCRTENLEESLADSKFENATMESEDVKFELLDPILPQPQSQTNTDAEDNEYEVIQAEGYESSSTKYSEPKLCPNCKNDFLDLVENIDLTIHQCLGCGHCEGEDDTMLPVYLRNNLKHVKTFLPCCGKVDLDECEVVEDWDGGTKLKCLRCEKLQSLQDLQNVKDDSIFEEWVENPEEELEYLKQHISCACGKGQGEPVVDSNSKGRMTVRCITCKEHWTFSTQAQLSKDKPIKSSVKFVDINVGDHICWDRPEGYTHHAIVCERPNFKGICGVCHYNGPIPSKFGQSKGVIVEEDIDLNKQKGQLYRMLYSSSLPPDKVIARARSRLHEKRYQILMNNCENFAQWCKTGEGKSDQANSFFKGIKRFFSLPSLLQKGITGKASFGTGVRSFSDSAKAGLAVGTVLVVAAQIVRTAKTVAQFQDHRTQGVLSDTQCLQVVVKRVIQGVGGVAGGAVGGVIGTLTIPLVGTAVGLTLGALRGEGLGHLIGARVAPLIKIKQKSLKY